MTNGFRFRHARPTALLSALLLWPGLSVASGQSVVEIPSGRLVDARESSQLDQIVRGRYADTIPPGSRYRAAGPFRAVTTRAGYYFDRTDIGSVIYLRRSFGSDSVTFDSTKVTREFLLSRIDSVVSKVAPSASGRRFSHFQDQFVGSLDLKDTATVDPRTKGRLVARTAVFERLIDSIPVFGSELRIGLMPEKSVGELRVHWPVIKSSIIADARALRAAVASRRWSLPAQMRSSAIKVDSVTPGIVHTGIAQPAFFAAPVVRVVFRPVARDSVLKLSRPRAKYFDSSGAEVKLPVVPPLARTQSSKKPGVKPRDRASQR